MNFILIDDQRVKNCLAYVSALKPNGKWEVTIKEYKRNRSLQQNRLYWKWITIIANEVGNTKDDQHNEFRHEHLEPEIIVVSGKVYEQLKSTTDLKIKPFAVYLTEIEVWAAERGIQLPIPDDINFIMMRD